jgi:hypothetical protein
MQAHFQLPKSAVATLTEISVMIHGLFGHRMANVGTGKLAF